MKRICEWVSRRLPLRRIGIGGDDYLLRYYVCGPLPAEHWRGSKPRWSWLPCSVYLHCFLRPDHARELHNHPWPLSLSLILSGGYREERRVREGVVVRTLSAPAVNVIRRSDFHRLSELLGGCVWTLFIAGRKVGPWGFWDSETGEFMEH